MGQKYATVDLVGNITAFYDSVDSPIPAGVTGTVEISDEDWQTAINTPGCRIEAGALLVPTPPTPSELLVAAQAAQSTKIQAACSAAIVKGFTSSALGVAHTYPSTMTDQINLQSSVAVSGGQPSTWTTLLWCASADGWAMTPHTSAQLQQVNDDWVTYRQGIQKRYADLVSAINSATSISGVRNINW